MVWPAIIGAAGSLIGGLLSKGSADSAREQSQANFDQQVALQREFAQQGVRWKVEDAKAAGVHPLFALGAQTHSYSPIAINTPVDNSMANMAANMGQDIGRAVHQTRTQPERDQAFVSAIRSQQVEGLRLDNELKRVQLETGVGRLMRETGPAFPGAGNMIPGQGNSPPVDVLGAIGSTYNVDPGRGFEDKSVTDVGYSRTKHGWMPVPGKDVKERIEDNTYQEIMHAIRNNVFPWFGVGAQPPGRPTPGKVWTYDPIYGYTERSDPSHDPMGAWPRMRGWFQRRGYK